MKLTNVIFIAVTMMAVSVLGYADTAAIDKGKKVKMDYTLKIDGQTIETTVGQAPLEFIFGEGKIIPGLENQIAGLKAGQEKSFDVQPQDGYGQSNPAARREFPKTDFPKELQMHTGMIIEMKNEAGQIIPAAVSEIKPNSIVLDFNHPLAGKKLHFDVKVLSVE